MRWEITQGRLVLGFLSGLSVAWPCRIAVGPVVGRFFFRWQRHPWVGLLLRDVDPDAGQFFEQRSIRKLTLHELLFALREIAERGDTAEQFLEYLQLDGRLIVGGRHEDAASRADLRPQHRRRIQIREEDQDLVLLMLASEVVDERGTP